MNTQRSEASSRPRGSFISLRSLGLVCLALPLAGCYLSHRIGGDASAPDAGAPPEACWTATSGPHWITEPPPSARAGYLLWHDGQALIGYGSSNLDLADARPRTLSRLDREGRPIAPPEEVFEPPGGAHVGPSLELESTSLGVLAAAYDEAGGCQLRALGQAPVVVAPEYCRGVSAVPTGGAILLLGRYLDPPDPRRFVHLTSLRPLRMEEGPLDAIVPGTFSWAYEPLDGERLLMATAPQRGGPLEVGVVGWRTAERALHTVLDTSADVRRLRLLPNRGGWVLGWLEQTRDGWRLGMMQLTAEGAPAGPVVHPDISFVAEPPGWRLVRRAGAISLVFDAGDRLQVADVSDETFAVTGRITTIVEIPGLGDLRAEPLDDGALLLAFTEGVDPALRVGTMRIECLP